MNMLVLISTVLYALLSVSLVSSAPLHSPDLIIEVGEAPERLERILPYKGRLISDLVRRSQKILYGTARVPLRYPILNITFTHFDASDTKAVALAFADEKINKARISVNSQYIIDYPGTDDELRTEFAGLIVHEVTHVLQNQRGLPTGLIEGIADYVRVEAGYGRYEERSRLNGRWDEGYIATASFIRYLDNKFPGFVRMVNVLASENITTSESIARIVFGRSMEDMYDDYVSQSNSL